MTFGTEKAVVRAHHASQSAATVDTIGAALAQHTAPDWHWRGMHPFHEQTAAEAVAQTFWQPFLRAMAHVQRREDVFFAGRNQIDDFTSVWVVSMGHLMALFDAPFLGIQPTRRIVMLRYAEFHRVQDGRIVETAFFCDLLHLLRQAGHTVFPNQTAAHLVQPGPMTHDGLLYADQPVSEGAQTLDLICRMIGAINASKTYPSPEAEMAECWHDDMLWWGPEGIGATYTIARYIEQHQRPFRTLLKDRAFNGHVARLAEGTLGGFFGWPNLSLTPTGGFMGLPAGPRADMRVVDIYRRDGDKLAENWIFIDMLHFLKMQGIDVLAGISG
ncbi:nuclear transport factor 2 family protein [Yoonia vestfoldensis]|uniref:nuclear transport factor 2 family protein n=1 Tax=Yoonia vestfoldensis TaxID=245188 RepID=UPI000381C9A8|nr:nuclear transport factor 2 family protein [Yoonia vestfoldensis]